MPASSALERDLGSFLPRESIVVEGRSAYLADETEGRGILGRAEAVVVPSSTEEVCKVLAWCYDHEVPVVPRGGGTGFAGGAVPLDGGLVLGLERLTGIRSFDPLLWRICVEEGQPPVAHEPALSVDVQRRVPDVTKVRDRLGWSAQVSLEEGLRRTVSWYRSQATTSRAS